MPDNPAAPYLGLNMSMEYRTPEWLEEIRRLIELETCTVKAN